MFTIPKGCKLPTGASGWQSMVRMSMARLGSANHTLPHQLARNRKLLARTSKTLLAFVVMRTAKVRGSIIVSQFDWEYHLLSACSLALVVGVFLFIVFFAT